MTNFGKVEVLMRVAFELEKVNSKIVSNGVLFDNLMNKLEFYPVILDYIYEQVKFYIFEKVSIEAQAEEFLRLISITNLKDEFNNNLQQWIKIYNT